MSEATTVDVESAWKTRPADVGDERRRTEMALLKAIRAMAETSEVGVWAADGLGALAAALTAVQQPWVQRGQGR